MSTRASLHVLEAATTLLQYRLGDLGTTDMHDLLRDAQPPELRGSIERAWEFLAGVDITQPPASDRREVKGVVRVVGKIDTKVNDFIETAKGIEDDKETAHKIWAERKSGLLETAGRLAMAGAYLRERQSVEQITVRDSFGRLRQFELNPKTCVSIGLNTYANELLGFMTKYPNRVALSPEAQHASPAIVAVEPHDGYTITS